MPAWNEERRIERSLDELLDASPRLGIEEIVVVDDGSTDCTAAIVDARIGVLDGGVPRLLLVRHRTNRGKGAALRTGLLVAGAPLVGYLDADLSVGPAGFESARGLILDGADVVIGYRISHTGQADGKGQPAVRRLLSVLFKRTQRRIVGLRLRDTQCPFKLFTHEAVTQLVPACTSSGWAFDVEILLAASRAGLRIREQPVPWQFVGGSTVHADVGTVWRTLRDLILLRLRYGGA